MVICFFFPLFENDIQLLDSLFLHFVFELVTIGYKYSYPFLSVDSGIQINDNFVTPLYKQIFNIEHPTMAFIGIPSSAPNFHMFDLQVSQIDF